jgi:HTH-type transcriptional regulator / antitoxin HigA
LEGLLWMLLAPDHSTSLNRYPIRCGAARVAAGYRSVIPGNETAKKRPKMQDYDRMIEQIGDLMDRGADNLSPEETSLLEMMSILVERYEQERYPVGPSKPGDVIRFLMEQRRLQQHDLVKVLGTKGHVSEILNGKRQPSKEQAKRLAEFFRVSHALFI